jgi:competence protein ComEC
VARKKFLFLLFTNKIFTIFVHQMKRSSIRIQAPLMPIAVSLMVGIATSRQWTTDWTMMLPPTSVALLLVCLSGRWPRVQEAGIWLLTAVVGLMWGTAKRQQLEVEWPKQTVSMQVVVASEPMVRGRTVVMDALVTGSDRKIRCRIARDGESESIRIGDRLEMRTRVKQTHEWQSGHFNYQRYMQCHGFSGEAFVGSGQWRSIGQSLTGLPMTERVRLKALCLRHELLGKYRQWGLSDEEYGVIAAMTLGDKTGLAAEVKDTYAKAGASHVLALSGLHLMMIYAVMSLFVGWWRWRTAEQVSIVLAIWAYALLVGLSASVVRSAFMITVYALTALGYRERMSVNTLAFTAIVMLAVNPLSLWDVSFELSMMAVLAIVLLHPLTNRLMPLHVQQRHRWLSKLWGLTTVSVAAQVGTAPLVAYYFGRLPVYFLLSSYIVIPAATVIVYLALVCVATGWWTTVQLWTAGVLAAVVSMTNSVLGWIAELPKSSVEGLNLSTLQLFLVYLLFGALWVLLALATNRKNVEYFRET